MIIHKIFHTGSNHLKIGLRYLNDTSAARIILSIEAQKLIHLNLVPDVVRDTAKAVDVELAIILGILAHHVADFEEGLLI